MIIRNEEERLMQMGTAKVSIKDLMDKADDMEPKWTDIMIPGNVGLTEDGTVKFYDNAGMQQETDMTEHAFTQICTAVGVPASYVRKCIDNGMPDLAVNNYDRWAERYPREKAQMLRLYNGVVHAQVTSRYNVFDHAEVMHGIYEAVNDPAIAGQYEANQAFMSPDKLHIRFVDFNHPLTVGGDVLHAGFTVSSNNVGSGALAIKYFLYRFVCKNGMVKIQNGGMMYRQTHLGDFKAAGVSLFRDIVEQVKSVSQVTTKQIELAEKKLLTNYELETYMKQAQRELHIGQKGVDRLKDLVQNTYDPTLWGFLNSVTEAAQDYTLDTRLTMEQWSGQVLAAATK